MIQTWTWHVQPPLGTLKSRTADAILRAGNGIMGFTSSLLNVEAEADDDGIIFSLKVSGKDRWVCQAHARDFGEKILKASKLYGTPVTHISTFIEPNRRGLTARQGRTPRPRPPRATPVS